MVSFFHTQKFLFLWYDIVKLVFKEIFLTTLFFVLFSDLLLELTLLQYWYVESLLLSHLELCPWMEMLINMSTLPYVFVYYQGDSMPILASFLRKNQRALKLSTLTTLNVLITNYGKLIFFFICSL